MQGRSDAAGKIPRVLNPIKSGGWAWKVSWGVTPRPTRERGSLDPVFGEESTGFSTQRLCRLKCREHAFFGRLRHSYSIKMGG